MAVDPSSPIVRFPGECGSAGEAIALSIERVREVGFGGAAVVLSARGFGDASGEDHVVEVGLRAGILVFHTPLQDVLLAVYQAGLQGLPAEEVRGVSRVTIRGCPPADVARVLDHYFRGVMQVRPKAGATDYEFLAERQ